MSSTFTATQILTELREFAAFSAFEQRYIRRSLDVGLDRQDAFRVWARSATETAAIRAQYAIYHDLEPLRRTLSQGHGAGAPGGDGLETFMGKLLRVSAFDLGQERLASFSSYRFLYERLLGADVRPWLPAAFCGAAALPQIAPERRKDLLQSISEAAATAPGWSQRPPQFFPEYVDLEEAA